MTMETWISARALRLSLKPGRHALIRNVPGHYVAVPV
jgi:hypothetical protein